MTELLFGLTVIFVVYVLYEVFKTVSQTGAQPPVAGTAPVTPESAQSATGAEAAPSAEEAEKTVLLRNPATGETSPMPSNYRFAKKWIKEALVSEGLLKKVYKNSELTESVSPTVKEALDKFKLLEKYHA